MAQDVLAFGAPVEEGGATRAADPLVRQLWLDVFRLVVLVVIFLMTLAILPHLVVVWGFYLAYIPVSIWALWLSVRGRFSVPRLWIFMSVDTLLVTFLAHLIGTTVTPTGIGFMVVLVAYALLGGRRMGWACMIIALSSYAALLTLEHAGLVQTAPFLPRDHPAFTNPGGAPSAWAFIIVFLLMVFAWLSFVVRRILDYHRQRHRSLISSQEALAKAARMARALDRANRLEGLGRLAGGISHDFNNLLTVIKGFTREVIEASGVKTRAGEDLEEVLRAAERAQTLVGKLLSFSRRHGSQRIRLDLNQLIEEARRLLEPALGDDLSLRMEPCRDSLIVHADPGQLEQLLVALAVNSRDAIDTRGIIDIQTRRLVLGDDDSGRPPGLAPGSYAELRFADNGPGMEPDVRARVFEPFFTTKPPGEGTGLGLSVAYGIARQNGGDIRVDSIPGKGCLFTLLLPCLADHGGNQQGDGEVRDG